MMFNEYMDHANKCAGYYSVTRKEEISLQQSETNRFKQKWLESSGGGYSASTQNPTPPPNQPGQQFNKNMQHIKQEHPGYPMGQGQYMNNQYKPPPVAPMQLKQMNQPNNLDANQHMMMKQQQMKASHAQKMQQNQAQMQYQQQQQQGNKYYEPQFIPNLKDNNPNQHIKRQSPSPMILNNNNNINNGIHPNNYPNQQHQQQQQQQQQPPNHNNSNKFGLQNPPPGAGPKNPKSEPHNFPNQQQGMYNHNPAGVMQGNNYPGQMHSNQLQNFKQPFQQQQQQSNYMHHQNYHQGPQQQHHNPQQQQQHHNPQQQQQHHNPQQQQQHHNPQQQHHNPKQQHHNPQQQSQVKKPYQTNEYSLDLNPTPRVNSPQNHQAQSPYPHVNSPKEWTDNNKRDLISPGLANQPTFNKKTSSSSLVQQQQQHKNELPIRSPAPSTTPSIESKLLNEVQKSPVRMMTQSPSNSSLNTSICVPTPINNQPSLIDLNQEQLMADDCDSSNLLSPLNPKPDKQETTTNTQNTSTINFQNSKSILSEINIDELFMHYPKVFEELFYSFKLNSIEQIEHDLRTYCEQQFKLNFSNKSSNCSSSNSAQQFSIRI